MPIIARINCRRSPLLTDAQAWRAECETWVPARHATIFATEADAMAEIERCDLMDVSIWTDPYIESFEPESEW